VGFVDFAHASSAEHPQDAVAACECGSGGEAAFFGSGGWGMRCGRVEQSVGLGFGGEHAEDFFTQVLILATGSVDVGFAGGGLAFEGGFEDGSDASEALGGESVGLGLGFVFVHKVAQ